jgi:hypothetical protein
MWKNWLIIKKFLNELYEISGRNQDRRRCDVEVRKSKAARSRSVQQEKRLKLDKYLNLIAGKWCFYMQSEVLRTLRPSL